MKFTGSSESVCLLMVGIPASVQLRSWWINMVQKDSDHVREILNEKKEVESRAGEPKVSPGDFDSNFGDTSSADGVFSGLNKADEQMAQRLAQMRLESIGVRSQMIIFEQLANGNFGSKAEQMQAQFNVAMDDYQKKTDSNLAFWQSDFLSLPPSQA